MKNIRKLQIFKFTFAAFRTFLFLFCSLKITFHINYLKSIVLIFHPHPLINELAVLIQ